MQNRLLESSASPKSSKYQEIILTEKLSLWADVVQKEERLLYFKSEQFKGNTLLFNSWTVGM